MQSEETCSYSGSYKDGLKDGFGRLECKDDTSYIGDFKDN